MTVPQKQRFGTLRVLRDIHAAVDFPATLNAICRPSGWQPEVMHKLNLPRPLLKGGR